MAREEDEVVFYGHPNVLATHEKTFEVTRNDELTKNGDCIVGVRANKACADLKAAMKRILANDDTNVNITIEVRGRIVKAIARGSDRLSFRNSKDIVVRASKFTCTRTLAINANLTASSIPREVVRLLQDAETQGVMKIVASRKLAGRG